MLIYFLICVTSHPLTVLRQKLRNPAGHAIVMASGCGAASVLGAPWLGEVLDRQTLSWWGGLLNWRKEELGAQTLIWGATLPCPSTTSPPHPPGQSHLHLSTQQGLSHQAVLVPMRRGRS